MRLPHVALLVFLLALTAGAWLLGAHGHGRATFAPDGKRPVPPMQRAQIEAHVATLAGPAASHAEIEAIFSALRNLQLEPTQLVRLLGSSNPRVVLFGIEQAGIQHHDPSVRRAMQGVLRAETLTVQLRNRFGKPTALAAERFDLQIAAGAALGADLTSVKRARAHDLLEALRIATLPRGAFPERPKRVDFQNYGLVHAVDALGRLGPAVRGVVARVDPVNPRHAAALDMARAQLGDRTRIPAVAEHLAAPSDPFVRWAALRTLALVRDPSTIPAIRRALADPFERDVEFCFGPPRRERPIADLAARTLAAMGVAEDG